MLTFSGLLKTVNWSVLLIWTLAVVFTAITVGAGITIATGWYRLLII